MVDIQAVVIGAGVVGLATARALSMRGVDILVLERNAMIGMETSARNSEVIHAGIYYPPDSLKAQLCVKGNQLMYAFCEQNNIDVLRCGKLLVATSDQEIPKLHKLINNGKKNGVEDLRLLSGEAAQELEPSVHCVMACLSPSTGVIDSHGLMQSLEGHIQSAGGEVVLNTPVYKIEHVNNGYTLTCGDIDENYTITCDYLINCSGHGVYDLATTLVYQNGYTPPPIYPAIGHYYRLHEKCDIQHLIYPMPDGGWLGTHLTLDTNKHIKFGPDCEWVDNLDYTFDDSEQRKQRFVEEIQRYLPHINEHNLQADYTGIRPKIYQQGQPAVDFSIIDHNVHGYEKMISMHGIESPGLTSSLAIGDYTCERLGFKGHTA